MLTVIIADWLDTVLDTEIPDTVRAFNLNLYDDGDNRWSVELVGTERFDPADEDWACDEVTDFDTREQPLAWHSDAGWAQVLADVTEAVRVYLENGRYAGLLKQYQGVGVGFVDGDLEILYSR